MSLKRLLNLVYPSTKFVEKTLLKNHKRSFQVISAIIKLREIRAALAKAPGPPWPRIRGTRPPGCAPWAAGGTAAGAGWRGDRGRRRARPTRCWGARRSPAGAAAGARPGRRRRGRGRRRGWGRTPPCDGSAPASLRGSPGAGSAREPGSTAQLL